MARDDDQHSFGKVAAAVLTGVVGVAAFNRLGGAKALAEGVPKVIKFAKTLSDDIADTKLSDYDYKGIRSLYRRHIGDGNSTLKTLARETHEKIDLQLDGSDFMSAVVKMEEMKYKGGEKYARKIFNSEYKDYIFENMSRKYRMDRSDTFADEFKSFLQNINRKEDLYKFIDEDNVPTIDDEFVDKFIRPENMALVDRQSFFQDVIDSLGQMEDDFQQYAAAHKDPETGMIDVVQNMLDVMTEELASTYGTYKPSDKVGEVVEGTRGLTVNDYIRRAEEFGDQILDFGDNEPMNLKNVMTNLVEQHPELGDVYIDERNLRVGANDEIINYQPLAKIGRGLGEDLAGTLPGKILKLTDKLNEKGHGTVNFFDKNKFNPLVDSDKNIIQLLKGYYEVDLDGNLEKLADSSDYYTMSMKHGSNPRMMKKMFGAEAEYEANSPLAKKFNIRAPIEGSFLNDWAKENGFRGNIARSITGQQRYNVIDEMMNAELAENDPVAYRENLKEMNQAWSNIVKAPNKKTVSKMRDVVDKDISKEILDALMTDDQDTIISVLSSNSSKLRNKDLKQLANRGKFDRSAVNRILSIKDDKTSTAKKIMNYQDLLKREAMKEVFMNEAIGKASGEAIPKLMLDKIEQSGVTGASKENLKRLAHWSRFQDKGMLFSNEQNAKNLKLIKESNKNILDMLTKKGTAKAKASSSRYVDDFQDAIQRIREEYDELTTKTTARNIAARKKREAAHGEAIMMRKGYNAKSFALDMIKDLNDFEKQKAHVKKYGYQYFAGKNSAKYVTDKTMAPYFMSQRLTEFTANKLGLSLPNSDMQSVGHIWKAIGLKGVLPVALGASAFSYLNYEAKNLTGTSITGAFAQGVGNVDLGLRKIADITGIGHILDAERGLNPITQYWFGEDYQDSRERKDYYENGYDEVRKGRWWSFGSAAEFRGGKIAYFQPNFVKRATSDWRDIGIYGSSKEKWAHSWLPTPRHPLAPIRRLLDPYWLERKHYKDRPYLETAPLFQQGTPWGAVLNPTIGQMIKPIRKMHRNETRRGLVDPRTLIAERNERLKAKAQDKEHGNLIEISNDGVVNMSYTPMALADNGNAIISLQVGNGQINQAGYGGTDYVEGVPDAAGMTIGAEGTVGGNYSYAGSAMSSVQARTSGYGSYGTPGKGPGLLSFLETTSIGAAISNSVGGVISPTDSLRMMNQQTMNRAATQPNGVLQARPNLAKMPFKEAATRITTKQDEADLMMTTSKHDFISDVLFSGKQLSGIYGFLEGIMKPDGGRKIRPESADKMASFTRSFWDANYGGLGGGVMEIARRFFPHEDHSIVNINPIRNTMPEWMPSRFLTGDPYTKVQKGEMRLPGKGYESIHKLHSDQFGRYGALDRMKILGDIAPWSDEYKLWRDIAKKTVTDAEGVKEMEAIKKRVEKQSKNHEFYNYKFLGNPTDIVTERIAEVDGSTFKTTSGKQYSLAGLKLNKKADISNRLYAGMEVQVQRLKNEEEQDGNIQAAVYAGGMNVNKALVDSGMATRVNKTAMDAKAMAGPMSQIYGAVMEGIAHAPIPFVHNKIMRIDTPLESFKNERVYGTPYSTWDHPIKGFIKPGWQKAWGRGAVGQGIALGSWIAAEHLWKNADKASDALKYIGINASANTVNKAASILMNVGNPGSFAATMMASIPTGLMGEEKFLKSLLSSATFTGGTHPGTLRNAGRIGAAVMLAGYGLTRSDKPLESTAIFSAAGVALAKQLNHPGFTTGKGAAVGAAVGFGLSVLRNPRWDKDKMFGKYIPEDTKRRWDIDEYYDRLEYIKYQGLYRKAARKARLWEGTNIRNIIETNELRAEANRKKIERIDKRINKIINSTLDEDRKEKLIERLNADKFSMLNDKQMIRGGKYTKAAVAYKQAADSTIYGLKENATSVEVLRAIPKGDKDFFMEFAKETDKKKQDEILKYVSPYQRRALQIAWGRKHIDKVKSNASYFRNHFMPGTFWAGWNPRVDMEHVKMKTIENEGMLLSDFGIYESQANEPAAVMAPSIGGRFDKANSGAVAMKARLQGALNGSGLIGVKVSVSPSSSNGIEVVANIANSAKIAEYQVREGLNSVFGKRLFYK